MENNNLILNLITDSIHELKSSLMVALDKTEKNLTDKAEATERKILDKVQILQKAVDDLQTKFQVLDKDFVSQTKEIMNLQQVVKQTEARIESHANKIDGLEDELSKFKGVVTLIKWLSTIGGGSGILAILNYLLKGG